MGCSRSALGASVDDGEDVVLAHQQDLLVALDLELLARVGGEQDAGRRP